MFGSPLQQMLAAAKANFQPQFTRLRKQCPHINKMCDIHPQARQQLIHQTRMIAAQLFTLAPPIKSMALIRMRLVGPVLHNGAVRHDLQTQFLHQNRYQIGFFP